MFSRMPSLTHQQQQEAVEQIQQLMQQGWSSAEAIAHVAEELRKKRRIESLNLPASDDYSNDSDGGDAGGGGD